VLSAFLAAVLVMTASGQAVFAAEAEDRAPATETESDVKMLIPVGHTVGIKLFADGVVVVETNAVATGEGSAAPARDAGIRKGDVIKSIDGEDITSARQMIGLIEASGGDEMAVVLERSGSARTVTVTAARGAEDGLYHIGALVRDSIAGIGTVTYVDPETGEFGALGHGILDADTQLLMPVGSGSIMRSTVESVKKGEAGNPGELHGAFEVENDLGTLEANTDRGIYGTMTQAVFTGEAVEVADDGQIHEGEAVILSNVAGDEVKPYTVQLTLRGSVLVSDWRDLMIRVTDEELLAATGGIVQGMSGSPILQDGRLVGAVTHVLVEDPSVGYGITIGHMLDGACERQESAA